MDFLDSTLEYGADDSQRQQQEAAVMSRSTEFPRMHLFHHDGGPTVGQSLVSPYQADYTALGLEDGPVLAHRTPLQDFGSRSRTVYSPSSSEPASLKAEETPQPVEEQTATVGSHMEGDGEVAQVLWRDTEICVEELRCGGGVITPVIVPTTEKGFFRDRETGEYTTYRRNYFAVNVGYKLSCRGQLHGSIHLTTEGQRWEVKAFGVGLTAAVDGPGGKVIELIQHTPKRDNGPKTRIEIVRVSPTPVLTHASPYLGGLSTFQPHSQLSALQLPFQCDTQAQLYAHLHNGSLPTNYPPTAAGHLTLPGQGTSYTFDRVQFKNATANNGKRRATQQYFFLRAELWADIRHGVDDEPIWVKVGHRASHNIVVRGRSPSHYANNENRNNRERGGPGAGGNNGAANPGPSTGTGFRGLYPATYQTGNFRAVQPTYGYHNQVHAGPFHTGMFPGGYPMFADAPSPTFHPPPGAWSSPSTSPTDDQQLLASFRRAGDDDDDEEEDGDDDDVQQLPRLDDHKRMRIRESLHKSRLVEFGGRRDSHHHRHRRQSGAHSSVTASSVATSPGDLYPEWLANTLVLDHTPTQAIFAPDPLSML